MEDSCLINDTGRHLLGLCLYAYALMVLTTHHPKFQFLPLNYLDILWSLKHLPKLYFFPTVSFDLVSISQTLLHFIKVIAVPLMYFWHLNTSKKLILCCSKLQGSSEIKGAILTYSSHGSGSIQNGFKPRSSTSALLAGDFQQRRAQHRII